MNEWNDDTGARSDLGGADADPRVFELDPGSHPDRWESMVAAIMERARPILEARRQRSLEGTLARWRRPVMLGSAGLAAAAAAVLLLLPGGDAGADEISVGVAGPEFDFSTVKRWLAWRDGRRAA